jgi:hypothetical protein
MTATVLPFRPDLDRNELVRQARSNYESIFPTETPQDRNRQRIDTIRKRDYFKFRIPSEPIVDCADDLAMDHADPGYPSDSPYRAPDSDPA